MPHHRIYVLTIPLTGGSLPGCRTLAQILVRRRSDGPIIVRDEGQGQRTTDAMCIQAIFADQEALDAVKGDLRRSLPHILMRVRAARRQPRGRDEPPCSCVLLSVQENRPCYFRQETCPRHCNLSGRDTSPESDTIQEQVSAVLRGMAQPGWAVLSPLGQSPHTLRAAPTSFPRTKEKRYHPVAH